MNTSVHTHAKEVRSSAPTQGPPRWLNLGMVETSEWKQPGIERKLVGEPSRVLIRLKNSGTERGIGAVSPLSPRTMEMTGGNKEARGHATGDPVVDK